MQCFTEVVPPTAVTSSISLPLLSPTANNLVVAKSSLLQIFALKSVLAEDGPNQQPLDRIVGPNQRKERSYVTKFVLIGQYRLSGTVTELGRVKALNSKSGGELLVVALRDAKLSLVQWDPEKYSIATVSIHYYEREDLQGSPWAPPLSKCATHLTVDPGSRCAAYKFGIRHLAILPFHQKGDELAIDDFDTVAETKDGRNHSISARDGDEDNDDNRQTPYAASFVLSFLTLDPSLVYPIHLAFLYGYREPTLGILSSKISPSSTLLAERRDPVDFTVYTLDLEQKASTLLLSVTGLPYDTSRIIPLPNPVGGSLLLGSNQIIHVDQSGKANGVAVNEFAKETTDFPLVSQSDLSLKLEGCALEQLGGPQGQMLLILNDGRLAFINFQIDGRAISGVSLQLIPTENGGSVLQHSVSCTSVIGRGRIFAGSVDSDSVLLGWSFSAASKRQRVKGDEANELEPDEEDSEIESEDENDLYADVTAPRDGSDKKSTIVNGTANDYQFKVHDSLLNLSPLRDLHVIQSCFTKGEPDKSTVDLVAITGDGKYGSLTRLRPHIALEEVAAIHEDASRAWAFHAKSPSSTEKDDESIPNTVLFCSSKEEQSYMYRLVGTSLREFSAIDFEPGAGTTIEVALLTAGSRVLQVLPTELRTYDGGKLPLLLSLDVELFRFLCPMLNTLEPPNTSNMLSFHVLVSKLEALQLSDWSYTIINIPRLTKACRSIYADNQADFSLTQIVPLNEDAVDNAPQVVAASVAEPFILLVRDDNSILLFRADETGDIEEVTRPDGLIETAWQSGALYDDADDAFHLPLEIEGAEEDEVGTVLMFLLGSDGSLFVSSVSQPWYPS